MENHYCFFLGWLLWDLQVAGGLGEGLFPSHTQQSTHLSDGSIPSHAPHHQWGSCSMPRARTNWGCGTGMSLQMLWPGLKADWSGLRGCSVTPPGSAADQPLFPSPPRPHLQLGMKPAAIIQAKHVNLADPAAPV